MSIKAPIFTSVTDFWHLFLGIISGLIPPIGVVIAIIYLIYQHREDEDFIQTIKDIEVYIIGCMIGIFMNMIFRGVYYPRNP